MYTKKKFPKVTGLPVGIFAFQKIQIWVDFGGPWNENCWYILGHLA
jgi:hypothetical protein